MAALPTVVLGFLAGLWLAPLLEQMLSARQAAVSQQLSRLRSEGLVSTRRDGKTIYYSIADERVREMIEVVYRLFCEQR